MTVPGRCCSWRSSIPGAVIGGLGAEGLDAADDARAAAEGNDRHALGSAGGENGDGAEQYQFSNHA